jgi:soluble lytic murein transglycosylase-like protein
MKNLISIFLLLVVSSVSNGANLPSQPNPLELHLPTLIRAAEMKYELPEHILEAMVLVESNGNLKAINKDDGTTAHKSRGIKIRSYGLLQMQLDSAKVVQILKAKDDGITLTKRDIITAKQLMIPEINLDYGAAYLKWLLKTHNNDIAWALSCYNAGPNGSICKNKKYSSYVGLILNAWITRRLLASGGQ